MIIDTLENFKTYLPLNTGFAKALSFLLRTDLGTLPPAKYEIEGEQVFAIIVKDVGKNRSEGVLETHQKYIDIQFVLSGTDLMGWKPKSDCRQPVNPHNFETDAQFYKDQPAFWFPVNPDCYALFFPEDAHTAMISDGEIHKVIIKVAVEN
jgi:YhcH/YjgK/YiaL family protein